jgi:hypothetical protein
MMNIDLACSADQSWKNKPLCGRAFRELVQSQKRKVRNHQLYGKIYVQAELSLSVLYRCFAMSPIFYKQKRIYLSNISMP